MGAILSVGRKPTDKTDKGHSDVDLLNEMEMAFLFLV